MFIITVLILTGFCLLFWFLEGRSLIKQRDWKGLALASVIILTSLAYGLDIALNKNLLPNPGLLLNRLKPLAQLIAPFSYLD